MSGETLNSHIDNLAIEAELEFLAMFAGLSEHCLDVREILSAEDFYSPSLGKCYAHLIALYDKHGKFIPEDMLSFVMQNSSDNEVCKAIKSSIANVISMNLDGLMARARKIRQLSLYRKVQNISKDLSYTTPETVMDVVESSLQQLSTLTENPEENTLASVQSILVDFVNQKCSGKTKEIFPTKYPKLDSILNVSKTNLIVLAARPSVGKSAFVTNLATKFSFQGYKTLFFSLEMSKDEVLNRVCASVGQIPHEFLVKNTVEGHYTESLGKAASIIYEKCLLDIDEKSCVTVNEIKRKCIKSKAQIVIIDYLQLMRPNGGRKYANKVDEVSEITRDLKIMAGELKVPVILLSQLNRNVEQRGQNARPQLSDLRDSGSIEQDANAVIFLSKTNNEDDNSDILAEIAKNRGGAVGKVIFQFDRNTQTFRETDKEYQQPEKAKREY